ncbi:MAG: YfhO family protein [Chloroflexota bacterium]|nr:YfhO family protein [Chloroflexota bacterium]
MAWAAIVRGSGGALSSNIETTRIAIPRQIAAPSAQSFWQRWRADILGVVAVLGIALLLGSRLLGPSVSTPGDRIAGFQPFSTIAPAKVRNWILTDVVQVTYPNRKFVNTALQHGQFPLWNPYVLTGHPYAASPLAALFYPTTLALGWLSAGHALDMEMLIHLFISALGMYVLVRVWGGKQLGAIAAGAAFAGCSTLTVWQQYGNILTAGSWLPWLVACFALTVRGRRTVGIGAGAIVLGLIILANDVQWLAYDLIFLGCYTLWSSIVAIRWHGVRPSDGVRAAIDWRAIIRPLVNGAAIVILGIAIGAVQLLPEIALSAASARTSVSPPYAYVQVFAASAERLLSVLAPNFYGTPAVLGSEWLAKGNYPEDLVYWGFFPLLLALTAPLWRRTATVWFLWAFLLFAASMVFGTPVLHLYALIPTVNLLEVARVGYLLCFVGAALCGLVLDRMFADHRPWRPLLVIGGLALLGRAILHLALTRFHPNVPLTLQPTRASLRWVTLLVLAGIVIFALPMLRWRYARLAASLALTTVIVIDMAHFSLPYNAATVDEASLFPRPQVFDALPQSVAPVRVVPINQKDSYVLLPPNMLEAFGIADLGADESLVLTEYGQFFRQIEPKPFKYNGYILVITDDTSPLLDLAGAEYFISALPLDVATKPLQLVAASQGVYLYRNPQAAPRAFITTNVKPVADFPASLQTLAAPGFTPCSVATIQGTSLPPSPPSQPGCVGAATITRYEPNAVHIRAETPVDGLLVLSDAYYAGWKVTVDGKTQPLYRADGVFRGVQIGAGTHDVRFAFRPPEVIRGGVISLVGLVAALFLVAGSAFRRARTGHGERKTRAFAARIRPR